MGPPTSVSADVPSYLPLAAAASEHVCSKGLKNQMRGSDLLRLLLLLLIVIVVVVIILIVIRLLVILLIFRFLRVVLLLFLALLYLAQLFPLLREAVGLSLVICDNDVVEDRATLHLPQVEANEAEIVVLVHRVVILVLWVSDLFRLPDALVCRVRDPLDVPVALVSRIVFHRSLPLAVLLIIPV